jgi:hypothetical protein
VPVRRPLLRRSSNTPDPNPGAPIDEKARQDLANKAKGKGPLNTGTQGIKKSGKK